MNAPQEVGVLVIGAGPAGAVAAAELARRGVHVMLVDLAPAGIDGHAVLLSRHAVNMLPASRGGLAPRGSIESFVVSFDDDRWIHYADPGVFVCHKVDLVAGLRRAAEAQGAPYRAGTVSGLRRRGDSHEASVDLGDGKTITVAARHIVVAAGVNGTRQLTGSASVDGVGPRLRSAL